jgi:hypothetical protein
MTPPVAVIPAGAAPEGAAITAPIPNCFIIDAKEVTMGAINQYLL